MDTDTSSSTRIAVLIDCDNVSSKHIAAVLEELATYGVPTVKRAYGDWTTSQLTGWKQELLRNAIQPVQQFANTVGKNSTDSALIIDAMDLLWQGNVEAFAIVSSDSDFTRLATRLRESGKRVFGLGRRKTPESLRRAVDQFIFLEVLQEQERQAEADTEQDSVATDRAAATASATTAVAPTSPESADRGSSGADAAPEGPTINLQSVLTKAINATSGDDGWAKLSQVGQHLSRAHADFDPRDFGHAKLSSLVDEQPYLDTRTHGSGRQVRLRQRRAAKAPAKTTATKAAVAKAAAPKATVAKATAGEPADQTAQRPKRASRAKAKPEAS
ncbi:NYN domain-containing protein [Aestuariimicrobium kwangyangense]|uniref:NYN domain-containing protein n=1 Tax=Aestuariimicrobium kwangyangense TaxID=396389 RepID=UPI0003B39D51|nr:NYN domain-containing protein [Aestuariimicrobium kwangyangense]